MPTVQTTTNRLTVRPSPVEHAKLELTLNGIILGPR